MDEFSRDYFMQQKQLFEDTLAIVGADNKCSVNTLANICIVLKDFQKLTKCLLEDIQSGKIHKTPKRYKRYKMKKKSKVEIVDVIDNKENV